MYALVHVSVGIYCSGGLANVVAQHVRSSKAALLPFPTRNSNPQSEFEVYIYCVYPFFIPLS